ncbi:unnamed protein product [Phaedon cochleariae]|uniref:Uncharacterized protein n=1 Tax=Phaedon cochleariae TaxID=80249 RepID=A0A9N9WZX3_PHACE|nr:unnamed protein product [Phaedon cochleariae]
MTGRNRSGSTNSNGANDAAMEHLINKVCANFVNQLETKFEKQLDKLHDKLSDMSESLNKMSASVTVNTNSITNLVKRSDQFEQLHKKNSLRIYGIVERDNENTPETIVEFINKELGVECSRRDLDMAFRLDQMSSEKPRAILVNFTSNILKNDIMSAKRKLKNSPISIYEDLSKSLYELLRKAKHKYGSRNAWASAGKIFVKQGESKKQISSNADL